MDGRPRHRWRTVHSAGSLSVTPPQSPSPQQGRQPHVPTRTKQAVVLGGSWSGRPGGPRGSCGGLGVWGGLASDVENPDTRTCPLRTMRPARREAATGWNLRPLQVDVPSTRRPERSSPKSLDGSLGSRLSPPCRSPVGKGLTRGTLPDRPQSPRPVGDGYRSRRVEGDLRPVPLDDRTSGGVKCESGPHPEPDQTATVPRKLQSR